MAAEHEGGDVLDADTELLGEEMAETRAESSTPAMPTTMLCGRPENSRSAQTIASSGLVMQMTKASGACFLMPSPTAFITFKLMPSRSSRLMPGLRGDAGGDDAHVGAGDVGIIVGALERGVIAVDRPAWAMSSALPWGMPSAMSNRTMSPSSRIAARWASVPPIIPAPISAIFLRAMERSGPLD